MTVRVTLSETPGEQLIWIVERRHGVKGAYIWDVIAKGLEPHLEFAMVNAGLAIQKHKQDRCGRETAEI